MKRGNKVNVRPFYHKQRKLRRAEKASSKEMVLYNDTGGKVRTIEAADSGDVLDDTITIFIKVLLC